MAAGASFLTVCNLARQIIFGKVKYSLDKRISDRYYMAQLDEEFNTLTECSHDDDNQTKERK
jgi:hypothetical protein